MLRGLLEPVAFFKRRRGGDGPRASHESAPNGNSAKQSQLMKANKNGKETKGGRGATEDGAKSSGGEKLQVAGHDIALAGASERTALADSRQAIRRAVEGNPSSSSAGSSSGYLSQVNGFSRKPQAVHRDDNTKDAKGQEDNENGHDDNDDDGTLAAADKVFYMINGTAPAGAHQIGTYEYRRRPARSLVPVMIDDEYDENDGAHDCYHNDTVRSDYYDDNDDDDDDDDDDDENDDDDEHELNARDLVSGVAQRQRARHKMEQASCDALRNELDHRRRVVVSNRLIDGFEWRDFGDNLSRTLDHHSLHHRHQQHQNHHHQHHRNRRQHNNITRNQKSSPQAAQSVDVRTSGHNLLSQRLDDHQKRLTHRLSANQINPAQRTLTYKPGERHEEQYVHDELLTSQFYRPNQHQSFHCLANDQLDRPESQLANSTSFHYACNLADYKWPSYNQEACLEQQKQRTCLRLNSSTSFQQRRPTSSATVVQHHLLAASCAGPPGKLQLPPLPLQANRKLEHFLPVAQYSTTNATMGQQQQNQEGPSKWSEAAMVRARQMNQQPAPGPMLSQTRRSAKRTPSPQPQQSSSSSQLSLAKQNLRSVPINNSNNNNNNNNNHHHHHSHNHQRSTPGGGSALTSVDRGTMKQLGCCGKMAKFLLFIGNALFWVAGISLGVWGILGLIDDHKYNLSQLLVFDPSSRASLFQLLSWSFITLGCASILVGFCGCSAMFKNSRWILGLYIFLILGIFALDLATGLLAIIFQERLVANVRLQLVSKLRAEYGIQAAFTAAIDYIQTRYECCGMDGHFDYDQSLWRLQRLGGFEATVARTCCHLRNTLDDQAHVNPRPVNESMCQSTDIRFHQSYRYRRGCLDDLEKLIRHKIWTFTIGCGAVGAIILLSLLFAICLCRSIPNSSGSRKSSALSSTGNRVYQQQHSTSVRLNDGPNKKKKGRSTTTNYR